MPSPCVATSISRRGLLLGSLATMFASAIAGSASAREGALDFLAIGDWGTKRAAPVAAAMGKWADGTQPRCVISTGDNFYPSGVASTDDVLWRADFEDVFTARGLQCPWYPVLGNHDHRGNVAAEIAYSAGSARWRMPARYFSRTEPLPAGGRADFFFIDTTPMKDETSVWNLTPFGGFVAEQMAWLEAGLSASAAEWKIVVGHHPVFSGGDHGPTEGLVRDLKPLMDRHGVQVYLNGHDHDLQHIVVDGVSYITCGGGAKPRDVKAVSGSLFARSELGFLAATVTKTAFHFSFVGTDGQPMYKAMIPNAA
ncbi:tartrate-resistant acid phosphatase type 5 family protein [Mesorhizobium sp. KR9-304]|uniref:purple acid phosphatase family protein n=1 Tax=Mesorhizobium sp. KR9-304 TaxID=3156614 RepID=UPI0032B51736